jgi:putative salt-induced outer membrane protein YdiY
LLRSLLLGSLALLIAAPPVCAQDPDPSLGPELPELDVRRLPPVEFLPLPDSGQRGGEISPSADRPAAEPKPAAPPAKEVAGEPEPPVKLWEGSFELGLDGTEGNSQTFNLRFGFDAKRTTPDNKLTLDLDYRKSTTESDETAHRALLDWRFERFFHESPWTCFVHGTVDYDEFKAFDVRVTVDLGLGYHLIRTESTSLVARVGGGVSHEIGSSDEDYVPEAVFGLDFERQLNKRQKLTFSAEHTPDVTDFGDFRLTARAGWEALIDREMNLSLKLSVLDRYDSTPDGAKENDLDYAAVLLWKF